MRKVAHILFNLVSLAVLFALVFFASVFRFNKDSGNIATQKDSFHNYFELNTASADAAPEAGPECFSEDPGESACECSAEAAESC
ncbi:hypothetical protein C4568_02705 [Candidatus Parcubacteria bacterium]|nr:MAG: hypothetical protein C4568_02705 [Candidatus Parcubacteria bacterium]